MSQPKPNMVVLFTDPVGKCQGRLCYWVENPHGRRVTVEYLGTDQVGEPAWGRQASIAVSSDIVIAHLLMHVARGGTTYGPSTGTTVIDLRDVIIPCEPL